MPQGQPFVFSCRMVVAHLQRVQVAREQLHLGHSCGESYLVWHGKGFSKEHGDERGLIFWGLQYGACGGSYGIEASSDASLSRQNLNLHLEIERTLLRKKLPEMFISSHLTTTIF
jgi:hypothetical protein